ncbi:MurR/RpiR family transcriptional regulator [Blastococcus mobilis]|uniref:Transcriptional regulator, RpiR family n=1 Tax=Blastococcus mobilis TaxID=1938746 RepID=A0A238UQB6_9ACTN|nr:MurR/RpiR family transcriptional regulator [Blastococcus mobilis]SNR24168.1 transcriptional regulator, RpiR family [Blastococcus mobilis]
MSIRDALKADLSTFSPQERRVARVLLADYPRAGLGTSAELATAAGVSPPTVVRFARSLGHTGFPALQQALLDELSERVASPLSLYEDSRANRAEGHWLERGVQLATDSIARSLTSIPKAELDAAVTLLADPRMRVTAVGGRFSGYLAGYLARHLRQIRPNVSAPGDGQTIDAADVIDADRRNVFVVYDFRRYQARTVEQVTQLADAGAQIICITDEWLSPAAQVATVVLPTSVRSSGAFDSAAAAFLLTELLVDAVLDRLGPTAIERMVRWEEASANEVLD